MEICDQNSSHGLPVDSKLRRYTYLHGLWEAKSLLGFDLTCVGVHQKRVNTKKRNHDDHNGFLLNCNIGCKKHTADLALKPSRFSQSVLHERFMSKWWLSSKIEAWKFTKNKLEKLVNSMKIDV